MGKPPQRRLSASLIAVTDLAPTAVADDEIEDIDEQDAVPTELAPISYFGADFDVHGLVRRYNQGAIIVPTFDPSVDIPDPNAQPFQRGRVWRKAQKDRFIESLLLGYPVPGIFLVEQPGKKYLVLDGQQRLTTLSTFYENKFRLDNVDASYSGLSYDSLPGEDRRKLDDTFIQAVIIRAPETKEDYESVYQIFERLNSGGTNLQPHEIRVALYGGPLLDRIRRLNGDPNWRVIVGPPNPRLKDQELILRVMALFVDGGSYTAPLKTFLNDFLGGHREGNGLDLGQLERLFSEAADVVTRALGPRPFRLRTQVNAAILDSVMVSLMARLERPDSGGIPDESWAAAYSQLLMDEDYLDAVNKATANEESVNQRLTLAGEAFSVL